MRAIRVSLSSADQRGDVLGEDADHARAQIVRRELPSSYPVSDSVEMHPENVGDFLLGQQVIGDVQEVILSDCLSVHVEHASTNLCDPVHLWLSVCYRRSMSTTRKGKDMTMTATSEQEPRDELAYRIGELAGRLNRSESNYLDAMLKASDRYFPDTEELAALTAQKLADAQELLLLLDRVRQL